MDLNKAMLIGRLTKDPELRTTQNGANVVNFSLVTNKKIKDIEKTEYHNLVAWNKLADIIGKYCRKGSKVYVEGELNTRHWQDQNGKTKYMTEILVHDLIMLDNKGQQQNTHKYHPQQPSQQELSPNIGNHNEINIDEIPF
jgi:single-strand DNA-binding protein